MQPQRDVGRLHRLPYHSHQILLQRLEVRLVPELDGEGFQGLLCVVLPPVEAAVDEGLDATSQRVEQGSYRKGRDDDDGELGCCSWPVKAQNRDCNVATPPKYTPTSAAVRAP